jgi:hypothetical protein
MNVIRNVYDDENESGADLPCTKQPGKEIMSELLPKGFPDWPSLILILGTYQCKVAQGHAGFN